MNKIVICVQSAASYRGTSASSRAKLRKGLNANENIKYSSEYNKEIHLKCVLIHQSIARTQSLSLLMMSIRSAISRTI